MATAAVILVVIVILAALSMEMKLGRANRIALAILEEQRKANKMLQQMTDLQKEAKETKVPEAATVPTREDITQKQRSTPDVQKHGAPGEPEVYRI